LEITNEFVVPADMDTTWDLLLDVERIVPCVAGAELTEIVDEETWKGKMAVKLGPIRLSFAGQVHLEEVDKENGRVQLRAKGQETRGKGNAQASVTSILEQQEGATKVSISTDLKLSGPVAQYGRGMIQDVSSKMIDDFAGCIASQLGPASQQAGSSADPGTAAAGTSTSTYSGTTPAAGTSAAPARPPAPQPEPLKAGRILARALWNAFVRTVKRLGSTIARLFQRSK
jgi:carbon monoxide dehydrogenase subunit G